MSKIRTAWYTACLLCAVFFLWCALNEMWRNNLQGFLIFIITSSVPMAALILTDYERHL